MSVLRAQISDEYLFANGGISFRIALVDTDNRGLPIRTLQFLQRPGPDTPFASWFRPTEEDRLVAKTVSEDKTVWHLPEGCGEALLEGLTRHFKGVAPDSLVHSLLSHEQVQRDKLEDALIQLAKTQTQSVGVALGARWRIEEVH